MLKFIKDSNLHKIFFSVLFSGLVFLQSPYSFSLAENDSDPIITRVIVKIDSQEEAEETEGMIPIREGDYFSLMKISESIKQIFKTGLFSDVKVARSGQERVQVTFLLTRKLFTGKISFSKVEGISKGKLRDSLYSLREGSPFSEKKLIKATEEIESVLRKEGYFHAAVIPFSRKDPGAPSVDVFFKISSGKSIMIEKIKFEGELLLSEERLRKEMKSKEGKTYIPSLVEEDIARLKEIYKLMGYQRAEVGLSGELFDEKGNKVSLTLRINPHERIRILVTGAEVPLSLLRPIWEEKIFEEWGLAEGEAKILSYMRKKGYLFASVSSSIKSVDNEIRVIYKVKPGEKYKIKEISFDGLGYFSSARLKRELGLLQKIPFLSSIGGERLFELPEEIEVLYRSHGFPRTAVDLNFIKKEKAVRVIFYVDEGPQEKIKEITVIGASFFKPQTLLEQISSFKDGPFFQPNIQKDIEKLEIFYLNQGFRGTKISAVVNKSEEGLVSLVFSIREGQRVRIEKIAIIGNRTTKRSTILRELRIKEGDYAFYTAIKETKDRLERLGVFSEIKIEEVPTGHGRENLVIRLREGKRNYFGLGIGLETKSEPYTFAFWNNAIRLRGTAELIRGNVLGTASQLSFVAQVSIREKRGVISWEQPYLFGVPWRSSFNTWIEKEERKSFDYERRGISLTAIKSPSKDILLLTTIRWIRTTLYNLQIAESEIDRQHHPFSASSISGSFIWDRRDDPFNPEKGSFLSFVAEWAYPIFNAESDYLKNFVKYQHFFSIFSGFGFSYTARLGLGTGKIPIHERFFGGGSNSFRGERFDELGPKDPSFMKPIGGKALLLFNFELKFPVLSALKDLSAAVFYDKGNIFPELRDIKLASLQDAIGFGIRYRTPLGPVRFDLGWNLDAPPEERKVLAFITIGNVF